MSARKVTVILTQSEAENLWSLADMTAAGEWEEVVDTFGSAAQALAGKRGMAKLMDALNAARMPRSRRPA